MILFGYVLQVNNLCQRDRGGPLTCNGKLTGVVSFGIGCANSSSPAVYTRIQHYAEWIEENLEPEPKIIIDQGPTISTPTTGSASILKIGAIVNPFIPLILF